MNYEINIQETAAYGIIMQTGPPSFVTRISETSSLYAFERFKLKYDLLKWMVLDIVTHLDSTN